MFVLNAANTQNPLNESTEEKSLVQFSSVQLVQYSSYATADEWTHTYKAMKRM